MIYTNQSAFDAVLTHLRQQGCKSILSDGQCAYRGNDGLKCAIGALISDNKYSSDMDDSSAQASSFPNVLFAAGLDNLDYELCTEMQAVHDTIWGNENWHDRLEDRFKLIAKEYKLNYTQPI